MEIIFIDWPVSGALDKARGLYTYTKYGSIFSKAIRLYLPKPNLPNLPRLIFTVTNDLTYDQRMQRICGSLALNGYEVLLVGRKLRGSALLGEQPFGQKRIRCLFTNGFAFYAEYNIRLFFFLLFVRADAFCAIDLDTILPNYFVSAIRRKKRLYDAHELFTEQKEIVTRPFVHQVWLMVERFAVPKFKHGYTVNIFIGDELKRRYGVDYGIVRNIPVTTQIPDSEFQTPHSNGSFIIYQGAVNEGRSFETLIPAMKQVDAKLVIVGMGNFFEQTKALVAANHVETKVELKGFVAPQALKQLTPQAKFGLTLFEATGLNQYYSLSNRFFDYIMAGIPQVCVGYPEYRTINDAYEIALLIDDTNIETIATALNKLMADTVLYERLKQNCLKARTVLNWGGEEKKLVGIWQRVLN